MENLIAAIIFGGSLIGIGTIAYKKIPILVELPETTKPFKKEKFVSFLKKKVENTEFLKDFSYETFLEKLLFKIRILILKTENKTFSLLQGLKEKQKKKEATKEEDNYWEEIKKSTTEFSSMETRGKKRKNFSSPNQTK